MADFPVDECHRDAVFTSTNTFGYRYTDRAAEIGDKQYAG